VTIYVFVISFIRFNYLTLTPSLPFLLFFHHSHDGTVLAVASSYTFEEGNKDFPPEDNVFLRKINDLEAKPRLKV
jgi:hypothetical protein